MGVTGREGTVEPPGLSTASTVASAVAAGAMVANLYYAQPLIALIAPDLGLSARLSGLIVTLTQLGYGAGLLLIVSLADRVENRRLILMTLGMAALALLGVALAPSAPIFLAAAIILGFCSSGAQVIVVFAASLAPEARRGQTVGNIMGGLLAGIMLARPVASMMADLAGWRSVFWLSAALMASLMLWLSRRLPSRRPAKGDGYGRILWSMGRIFTTTPPLRRRALYQGIVFAIFNLYWTAAPLMLVRDFGFTQKSIALFALAGAGGAIVAPFAGRVGDRGYVRAGTAAALVLVTLSIALSGWAASLGSIAALAVLAILLDAAAQLNQVLGQRVIYALPGEAKGRMNALYMTIVFLFGASGSALATLTYDAAGWWGAIGTGTVLGVVVLASFWPEWRRGSRG